MRSMPAVALVLITVASAPPQALAGAEPFNSKTFENWTATCDNLRDCVVIGSSEEGDGLFYVRVQRSAIPQSEPKVKVVLAASDPISDPPGSFQLRASARAPAKAVDFSVSVTKDDPDGAALSGYPPSATFLPSIEAADTLDYVAGTLKGRLALRGLDPALRYIDEHQGRLTAQGRARATDMPPPVRPMVEPASVTATAVAVPKIDRALLDMAKPACDPEVVEAHSDAAAWMLGPNRQLVAVPCTESPYNLSVALFTTDAEGGQPRPAMLEQPPRQGDAKADNVVVNYEFDPKTLTLTSLDKGRGLGDCGASRTWVWTGEIFALLRAAELEACPGALPEDWPPVFQASRR